VKSVKNEMERRISPLLNTERLDKTNTEDWKRRKFNESINCWNREIGVPVLMTQINGVP
jgi:hypothetical protein